MGGGCRLTKFTEQVSRPADRLDPSIVDAEAEQVERLEERPGHASDPRFLCPTGTNRYEDRIGTRNRLDVTAIPDPGLGPRLPGPWADDSPGDRRPRGIDMRILSRWLRSTSCSRATWGGRTIAWPPPLVSFAMRTPSSSWIRDWCQARIPSWTHSPGLAFAPRT